MTEGMYVDPFADGLGMKAVKNSRFPLHLQGAPGDHRTVIEQPLHEVED